MKVSGIFLDIGAKAVCGEETCAAELPVILKATIDGGIAVSAMSGDHGWQFAAEPTPPHAFTARCKAHHLEIKKIVEPRMQVGPAGLKALNGNGRIHGT